jgi:hypothetical protein
VNGFLATVVALSQITLTSPRAAGVTRKWTRLQDYGDEVSSARIYAGFHYRFSTEAGRDMVRRSVISRLRH